MLQMNIQTKCTFNASLFIDVHVAEMMQVHVRSCVMDIVNFQGLCTSPHQCNVKLLFSKIIEDHS